MACSIEAMGKIIKTQHSPENGFFAPFNHIAMTSTAMHMRTLYVDITIICFICKGTHSMPHG